MAPEFMAAMNSRGLRSPAHHRWRFRFLVAVVTLAGVRVASAQTVREQTEPLPSFEVVSIRLNQSQEPGRILDMRDPGRIALINVAIKGLLTLVFAIDDYQLSGAPSWLSSVKYDINAKVDDGTAEQLRKLPRDQRMQRIDLMIQSLLIDRFRLKYHHETRQVPAYLLVIAKNGPKIHQAKSGDTYPHGLHFPDGSGAGIMRVDGNELTGQAVTIGILVARLKSALERPVEDKTGLTGNYDFDLKWTPQLSAGLMGSPPENAEPTTVDSGESQEPPLSVALKEQLGLRLVPTKTQVDTIVIDHIEKPSEN